MITVMVVHPSYPTFHTHVSHFCGSWFIISAVIIYAYKIHLINIDMYNNYMYYLIYLFKHFDKIYNIKFP